LLESRCLIHQSLGQGMNLPVLVIAYSRPEGLSKILQTLLSNGIQRIYIAVDGAKNQRDLTNQKDIESVISNFKQLSGKKIHVLRQKQNLGIAVAIIGAVDWFFANEKRGLILEDDLVVSDQFFKFAKSALEIYENNDEVWMISGTQLFPNSQKVNEVVWSNYPMIWGWASWSAKWYEMRRSLFEKKIIPLSKRADSRYLFWATGANRVLSGKVDTWDIPLACEFLNQNKLCAMPAVNLVSNIGTDSVSTNTKKTERGVGTKIALLDSEFIYTYQPEICDIQEYNKLLETQVFNIRFRHVFLPYYSLLFDWIRFPKTHRKEKLSRRIKLFEC